MPAISAKTSNGWLAALKVVNTSAGSTQANHHPVPRAGRAGGHGRIPWTIVTIIRQRHLGRPTSAVGEPHSDTREHQPGRHATDHPAQQPAPDRLLYPAHRFAATRKHLPPIAGRSLARGRRLGDTGDCTQRSRSSAQPARRCGQPEPPGQQRAAGRRRRRRQPCLGAVGRVVSTGANPATYRSLILHWNGRSCTGAAAPGRTRRIPASPATTPSAAWPPRPPTTPGRSAPAGWPPAASVPWSSAGTAGTGAS
jgi:hypothetical protein